MKEKLLNIIHKQIDNLSQQLIRVSKFNGHMPIPISIDIDNYGYLTYFYGIKINNKFIDVFKYKYKLPISVGDDKRNFVTIELRFNEKPPIIITKTYIQTTVTEKGFVMPKNWFKRLFTTSPIAADFEYQVMKPLYHIECKPIKEEIDETTFNEIQDKVVNLLNKSVEVTKQAEIYATQAIIDKRYNDLNNDGY